MTLTGKPIDQQVFERVSNANSGSVERPLMRVTPWKWIYIWSPEEMEAEELPFPLIGVTFKSGSFTFVGKHPHICRVGPSDNIHPVSKLMWGLIQRWDDHWRKPQTKK